MGHRGERSEPAKLRRTVKRIILEAAFKDRIIKETVSQTTVEQAIDSLLKAHPELADCMFLSAFQDAILGLVLTDSYGKGAFQEC